MMKIEQTGYPDFMPISVEIRVGEVGQKLMSKWPTSPSMIFCNDKVRR